MQPGTVTTFGLGDALFALPVTLVQEILDTRPVSPLPDTPAHLLGVIDVRGTSVAVVDLRRLLGQPPREDAPDTRFVVLLLEHEGQMLHIALRVDRVIEVAELDGGRIEPVAGAGLLAWDPRAVEGIGRRDGAFVTVLRLGGLFDRDAAATLVRTGATMSLPTGLAPENKGTGAADSDLADPRPPIPGARTAGRVAA